MDLKLIAGGSSFFHLLCYLLKGGKRKSCSVSRRMWRKLRTGFLFGEVSLRGEAQFSRLSQTFDKLDGLSTTRWYWLRCVFLYLLNCRFVTSADHPRVGFVSLQPSRPDCRVCATARSRAERRFLLQLHSGTVERDCRST